MAKQNYKHKKRKKKLHVKIDSSMIKKSTALQDAIDSVGQRALNQAMNSVINTLKSGSPVVYTKKRKLSPPYKRRKKKTSKRKVKTMSSNLILKKEPVPIGKKIIDLITVAWASRRPIILKGAHGLGKSEIVEQAAKELGIDYVCMDLSIMEPPDLVGLPIPDKETGVTRYLPPASLPQKRFKKRKAVKGNKKVKMVEDKDNEGILVFEELNRCGPEMQSPCLQLLTARKLNDYELPSGWSVIACINPSDDEDFSYAVNDLDPALTSRFMEIEICADKKGWLKWAENKKIHEAVIQVVSESPDPFDSKNGVPPRTWKYVSDILNCFNEYEDLNDEVLKDAVMGYINTEWTSAVIDALVDLGEYDKEVFNIEDDEDDEMIDPQTMSGSDKWPDVKELVSKYTATYSSKIKKQRQKIKNANMELFANTFNNLRRVDIHTINVFMNHLGKERHTMNINKLFVDVGKEGRSAFRNSLDGKLREGFGIDMDPTNMIVKKILLKSPGVLTTTIKKHRF